MTAVTPTDSAAWLARYYALCETDIDAAMEYWAPEGELRFANEEPVIGRESIRSTFKQLVAMWASETHTLVNLWELPDGVLIFELDVAFRLHDGTELSVRGAAVNRIEGEQFVAQRVYVDLGPVWAAAQTSAVRTGAAG